MTTKLSILNWEYDETSKSISAVFVAAPTEEGEPSSSDIGPLTTFKVEFRPYSIETVQLPPPESEEVNGE